jgi:hypothetical protein
MDGVFWKGLDESAKVRFLEGYSAGWYFGFNRGQHVANPAEKSKGSASVVEDLSDITFGTLVEGVDKCYADFRNSNLLVSDCVAWAALGVHGVNDKDREGFLETVRATN